MNNSLAVAIGFAVLLAIIGPPMWWSSHGRKPGEKREKKWGAIIFGIVLVGSVGATNTAKSNWLQTTFVLARALAGVWLIAFGTKGSPAK